MEIPLKSHIYIYPLMTAGAASAALGLGHVLGDASLAGAEESGSRGSRGEEMGGSGGGVHRSPIGWLEDVGINMSIMLESNGIQR